MTGPAAASDDHRSEAGRWLAVAVEDVRIVDACLALFEPALGGAAYHCQQAAEKLIKGLLIIATAAFPRTHDLTELGESAAMHYPQFEDVLSRLGPMTTWNTAYRYPGTEDVEEPPPSPAALQSALADINVLTTLLRSLTAGSVSP